MKGDIESKIYDVKDSVKMKGMGDKLERILSETENSIRIDGATALSDDDLDMVAGGIKILGEFLEGFPYGNSKGKGGLTC